MIYSCAIGKSKLINLKYFYLKLLKHKNVKLNSFNNNLLQINSFKI